LSARADANHIAPFGKMVGDGMPAVRASFFGFFDYGKKVSEIEIFEDAAKSRTDHYSLPSVLTRLIRSKVFGGSERFVVAGHAKPVWQLRLGLKKK
jgi:hypothetical protein